MIPSTLAAEVSGVLRDFLSTGFGPSNPALSDVVKGFLDDSDNLLKGPYLSVDLPFQRAPQGGEPFPDTPLGFTPYRHQRTAFDRLTGGRSTVIATGTGSGKTECFLYPVLDHCRTQAGTPGVKAIVIYPMNALASDQARRIAAIVDRTPSLRGRVTAGLYVGETGASPRRRMGADHLAREALIIVGARASSLLSTALAQLFASRHNDDRKVIAFSDNVQDAAHRGSFFAARTWRNGLRAAIAQVIEKNDGISLADLPDRMLAWWSRTDVNPAAFDEERFISEFIAPDRLWFRDFEALRDNGAVPAGSGLLSWVQRRVRWDTFAELTFGAAVGRTLERTHVAAVGVDLEALECACEIALRRIREDFGELRVIDEPCVRALVLGVLRRMRERGAVESRMFDGYLASGGNPYAIRDVALQDFGPRSSLPVFPAPAGDKHGVEALAGTRRSWYQLWAEKVLTPVNVLAATRNAADVLRVVMSALGAVGLITELPSRRTKVWALDSARLCVTSQTVVMACGQSSRKLVVPAPEAAMWKGVPCLDPAVQDCYLRREPGRPTWAGDLYRRADIRRIVSAEHTALVSRQARDRLQERFAAPDFKPWEPNLLSATPTLKLGVDISPRPG